jgi:hypothetical protein
MTTLYQGIHVQLAPTSVENKATNLHCNKLTIDIYSSHVSSKTYQINNNQNYRGPEPSKEKRINSEMNKDISDDGMIKKKKLFRSKSHIVLLNIKINSKYLWFIDFLLEHIFQTSNRKFRNRATEAKYFKKEKDINLEWMHTCSYLHL